MLLRISILLLYITLASARKVLYGWNIGWMNANPDGRRERPVMAVNGQWPPPIIRATVGDDLLVTVHNNPPNETTSLHFHGLHQEGSNQMDGPPHVVACPVPIGTSYTYRFRVKEAGTFWWHWHSNGQYMDGLRGALVISDPRSPYQDKCDSELVMSLSDWYHDLQAQLAACYLSPDCNPSGAEPVSYSALVNDNSDTSLRVRPGETYFVHVINMAAFAQMYINFEDHNVTIIEVDGVYTQPRTVSSLYVATGRRYGVLLTAKPDPNKNYAIPVAMDVDAFDNVPNYLRPNTTATLMYDTSKPVPREITVPFFDVIDDITLEPWDRQVALQQPKTRIELNLELFPAFGQNRAGFNGVSYLSPLVPTLYTVVSAPIPLLSDTRIYGDYTNAFVIDYGDVVEITIHNTDDGQHPLHIHGHQVQLISRVLGLFNNGLSHAGQTPIRRDTWTLAGQGTTVIRFVADNPGVWHFHCHMEWHLAAGLAITLVEAPKLIQAKQKEIDANMESICQSQGIVTTGNAAGNAKDWLNLVGQRSNP
ncbi:iron transport multicopper oxidase FET3 precursor [Aureobasidium namibiae CBS 147.97]|uniref:Iron transport multicopper oxidase FET3 n=1 Tax=Aureobasidium namibiae CBS 147.97 TaxID=1043004 RepID=A0A074X0I4_9PEZI